MKRVHPKLFHMKGGFSPAKLSPVNEWWNLADESGGTIVGRISGTVLTLMGGCSVTDSGGQKYIEMDGTDDWLRVSLSAGTGVGFNKTMYWGLGLWVYVPSTAATQSIVEHAGTGHSTRLFWRTSGFNRLYGPSSVENVSDGALPTSQWNWWAASYDGTQTGTTAPNLGTEAQNTDRVKLYMNDSQVAITPANVGGDDEVPGTLTNESSPSGKFFGIGSNSAGGSLLPTGSRIGQNIFGLCGERQITLGESDILRSYQEMTV